jgi:restriction system protein
MADKDYEDLAKLFADPSKKDVFALIAIFLFAALVNKGQDGGSDFVMPSRTIGRGGFNTAPFNTTPFNAGYFERRLGDVVAEVRPEFEKLSEALKPAAARPEISVGMVITPEKLVAEGVLVRSASAFWAEVVQDLQKDWTKAYRLDPRIWEEMVAGAYKKAGFDEVILTPRSGDHGRDVIATKHGVGSVRILGSVKAYRPGHQVTKEEVHALAGVLNLDTSASKGIFTTTSDFAPKLLADPFLAKAVPHRIELMNGEKLRKWLVSLANLKK